MAKKKKVKKITKKKKQRNKSKIGISFYGAIILTLIIHYLLIGGINVNSTIQMAISFLIFNIIFGIINIFLKIDFGGEY